MVWPTWSIILNISKNEINVAYYHKSSYLFLSPPFLFPNPPPLPFPSQHWKDISAQAKDFIDKTLVLDPNERLTASQAFKHPWLVQSSQAASNKNLHRTISENLLQRQSQRANSTKSSKSAKSMESNKSNRSGHSLRSDRRRVQPEEIEEFNKDPEVQAELASLGSHHSNYA